MGLIDSEKIKAKQFRTNFLIKKLNKLYENEKIEKPLLNLTSYVNIKNVLVVAPHPDDEVIGCGGFIQNCVTNNINVSVLFLTQEAQKSVVKPSITNGIQTRIKESYDAKEILNYAQALYLKFDELSLKKNQESLISALEEYFFDLNPDLIVCPYHKDFHSDHREANIATIIALNRLWNSNKKTSLKDIMFYELWGPCLVNAYFVLTPDFVVKKKASLDCYKSQLQSVEYQKIMDFINLKRTFSLKDLIKLQMSLSEELWIEGYYFLQGQDSIADYLKNIQDANKYSYINI
ncbi:MAG: PIG-L deacetylase family protein [Candidatus Hodarchaeota archaeon]